MMHSIGRQAHLLRVTAWTMGLAHFGFLAIAHAQGSSEPSAPQVSLEPLLLAQVTPSVGSGREATRRVKDAPYCAVAIHESTVMLADGNRIVRSHKSEQCRDGEGRVRHEYERGGRKVVSISDPVQGQAWMLDPERKLAIATPAVLRWMQAQAMPSPGSPGSSADSSQWREYGERMREWARSLRQQRQAQSPSAANPRQAVPPSQESAFIEPVVISEVRVENIHRTDPKAEPSKDSRPETRSESRIESKTEGRHDVQVERRVEIVRLGPGQGSALPPIPPIPPLPPIPAISGHPALPGSLQVDVVGQPWSGDIATRAIAGRGPAVVSSLGSKEIEGLKVVGERSTWTIEAGQIGNEKPIVITRDRWFSPDLMVVVSSRDFDPRSGEQSYRLSQIRRGEPDPALFKVPSEFTLREPLRTQP